MKALIFPGQGSQKAGMASEFQSNFKIVKDIFERVDEALKFKLSKIILNGSDEELKKTEITQCFICFLNKIAQKKTSDKIKEISKFQQIREKLYSRKIIKIFTTMRKNHFLKKNRRLRAPAATFPG